MMSAHLLSWLIALPVLGGVATLVSGDANPRRARWIALAFSIATLLLCFPLLDGFDAADPSMQFVFRTPWLPSIGVNYHVGVDGVAVALIALTAFTTVLVLVGAWEAIDRKVSQYFAAFLVLEGLMIGVFCALDALLFYVFFEAMLIPMFIIIGVWGGPRRVYATIKFFLYTFFGSIFMLIGLIYLYLKAGTWDLAALAQLPLDSTEQAWLFFSFLLAFAVKVPMFPVHTWLPDAHVEAPTGGSVILAAIMLKIGGFGFMRFSLPITPDASHEFAWLVIALSLIAIVYIGFVALVQQDMKKLIAYSSISHMGFVTLGAFIPLMLARDAGNLDGARLALQGAMVQMISHGFISAALFSCVGVLYDRVHSRMIGDYGGVANTMPWFAFFAVFFAMANSGLPGTSGFVGEFMVILASFQAKPWIAATAALTLILGAAYTLWMVKRVVFGEATHAHVRELKDIDAREALVLGGFAAATLLFGLWPAPLTELMDASIGNVVEQLMRAKA
jgi:NADH-quinone oxidoreductase subunit M